MAQQLKLDLDLSRERIKPGIRDFRWVSIKQSDLPMARIYVRDNLRRLRKNQGWSIPDFARCYGFAQNTIRRIECGALPCMVTTHKLIQALGLSIEDIRYELRTLQ
jgi:DNA-binding XRE family transcriptional regulator